MNPSTCADIDDWISKLHTLVERGRIAGPGFLKPCDLVTLALTLKRHNAIDLNLPARVMGYAARMGVWEAVGLSPPIAVSKHFHGDRFCEITPLVDRARVGDVASALAKIATSNQAPGASAGTEDALFTILSEIAENCHAHAEVLSGLHGLACAQTWYRGGRAQIAIADLGIGIRRSLASDPTHALQLRNRNAVDLATEFGVSSKLGRNHSGYGLTLARGLAEASRGSFLYIQSHGEVFYVDPRRGCGTYRTDRHESFPGTLVVFEWSINSTLDTGPIYRLWPDSEESGDDYF